MPEHPVVTACVVGSLNADLVLELPALPAEGETVLGHGLHRLPGGKGANQAVALARLGARTSMVGRVGQDGDGTAQRAALAAAGVRTDQVRALPGRSTGLAVVLVDPAGHNAICVVPGANQDLDPAGVDGAVREIAAGVVLAQLEIPQAAACAALRAARASGGRSVLNAAPAGPGGSALLGEVDVLVVNEIEAGVLAGTPDGGPGAALDRLRAAGPEVVVVTLGGAGCLVGWTGGTGRIGAFDVEVIDTVGAGDCFVAAFALRLAEGADPEESARFATAAAALAVGRRGAQAGMPTRAEVEEFLSTHQHPRTTPVEEA